MELILDDYEGGALTASGKRRKGGILTASGGLTGAGGLTACGKAKYSAKELSDLVHEHIKLHGAGFFSDFWSGLKDGFSAVASVAKPILSMIPHPAAQTASHVMSAVGLGKRGRGRPKKIVVEVNVDTEPKKEVVSKTVVKSSKKGMSDGQRKYQEALQALRKKHGCSFKDAMQMYSKAKK